VTLDTRSKILPVSCAAEWAGAVFVAMHLDPLTAAHAERLAELALPGRPVVVLLYDLPDPLLPLDARAELAASLSTVQAVIPIPEGQTAARAASLAAVDERAGDLARREALVRHVFEKHAAAEAG